MPSTANATQAVTAAPQVFTVTQFAARHPAFSAASLRDLIFRANDRITSRGERISGNGLESAGAILRVGRKILISEPHFWNWLVEQQRKRHGARKHSEEQHAAAA